MVNRYVRKKYWVSLIIGAVLVGLLLSAANNNSTVEIELTDSEKQWLADHPVINVSMDPQYPPVEFFENEVYQGISVDYLNWIEGQLDITFNYVYMPTWTEVLNNLRDKKLDLVPAAAKTPQRDRYMLFTEPHVTLPTAIIGTTDIRGDLSEANLSGLKVAVVSNYAIHDYLVNTHPEYIIEAVPNMEVGLKKVSFGLVDVLIADISVASYTIDQMGLTNLRAVGTFEYEYDLRIGVRDDWPILRDIMQKALDAMPESEQKAITQKWISLRQEGLLSRRDLMISAVVVLSIIVGGFVWNRVLKRQVSIKTEELRRELIERVEIEADLANTKETLREIIDLVPHIIYAKDHDGRFILVNKALAEFHGLPVEMMEGKLDIDIYKKDFSNDVSRFWQGDNVVKSQNQSFYIPDQHLVDINGDPHIYQFRKIPFHLKPDDRIGILGVGVEITELKNVQDELATLNEELESKVVKRTELLNDANYRLTLSMSNLKQKQNELVDINDELETTIRNLKDTQHRLIESEKMAALGRLLAGLAHEINTPVGIGITLTSFLSDEATRIKELAERKEIRRQELMNYLDSAVESTHVLLRNLESASDMIEEFKNISKEQKVDDLKQYNLKDAIEKILFSINPKLENNPHHVFLECPDDIVMHGYPGMLYQVITNLVINAVMHGFDDQENGTVKISAKRVFDHVSIFVEDDGRGIPKEDQDKIFEPFYTTKRGERTGLGLNIVYNIVTSIMGGIIELESTSNGTRFKIIIPKRIDLGKIKL